MFNREQREHMEHLATLPPERKCGCGWYVKWDCYNCNLKELQRHGGVVEPTQRGTLLLLPSGDAIDYVDLVKWLKVKGT